MENTKTCLQILGILAWLYIWAYLNVYLWSYSGLTGVKELLCFTATSVVLPCLTIAVILDIQEARK